MYVSKCVLYDYWQVYLLENFVPTPFVAFAVRELNCVGKTLHYPTHSLHVVSYTIYLR